MISSRAPPASASSIVTVAAVGADQAVDDVHAQAGAAAWPVLPELGEHPLPDLLRRCPRPRRRRGSARRVAGSVMRSRVTVTGPSPCRIALSTTLVTTWVSLSGSAKISRQVVGVRRLDRCGGPGADALDAPLDERRDVARPRVAAAAGRCRCRATSSSSVISRLEPVGVGVHRGEHQLLLLVVEPVPRLRSACDEALHAGQRRAQLVGDGGDQVGAVAVEPGPAAARAE